MSNRKVKMLKEMFEELTGRRPSKRELRWIKQEYKDGIKLWQPKYFAMYAEQNSIKALLG